MTETLKVLIIEDDPDVALGCEQALQLEGIPAECAGSAEQARRRLGPDFRGIIVSDVRLPKMDGLAFLRETLAIDPELPVVLITGHGDVTMAVQAMKDGAYDFIQKPFAPEYLVDVVRRALEKRRLVLEVRDLRRQLEQRDQLEGKLIGRAPAMQKLRQMLSGLADSSADVLIHGETGTGKELVARCLHEASPRRHGNFVAINCGGLPETLFDSEIFGHEAGAYTGAGKRRIGKIEHANGGTLFLDEIESMPLAMQIKLLRVLQERTLERLGSNTSIAIDCRVIAATKTDLLDLSARGGFRNDLYYRLSVATLNLPPLRERREDIPMLVEHLARHAATRHGLALAPFPKAVLRALMDRPWPGNVRELAHSVERLLLLGEDGAPDAADLPAVPGQSVGGSGFRLDAAGLDWESHERSLLAQALALAHGNRAGAARLLNLPYKAFLYRIEKHGLDRPDGADEIGRD